MTAPESSNLDLVARLRAPCGESLTLLTAEGSTDKYDPLRLAAAREIERLQAKYAAQCNRWAHCRAALDQIREHKHHGDCTSTCAVHLIDVADMAVIADDADDGGPAAPEPRDG